MARLFAPVSRGGKVRCPKPIVASDGVRLTAST